MKKSKILVSCVCLFVGAFVLPLWAVELEKPTANLTERFVTTSGWTASASAGVVAGWTTNECVAAQYASRSAQSYLPQTAKIKCGTSASSGIFSGDLSSMGSISVDVRKKNLAISPAFYFVSGSGATWYLALDAIVGLENDVWNIINVPLLFDDNTAKCWSAPNGRTEADFVLDIKNVVEIGFSTVRTGDGNYAQLFEADNVKLIGPWGSVTADGVPLAWAFEYGLTNNLESVGRDDADHDGFKNMAEFLAGTNPNDSNSFFRVDIARNEQGRLVVKWNDNKDMMFTLLESTNLVTFEPVPGAVNIKGVGQQRIVDVNGADVTGVRFYKVQISR